MKITLVVITPKVTKKIPFHVGHGKQTFKWLGLAAAEIAAPMSTARPIGQFGVAGGGRRFLPSNIYSELCSFHHPDHRLVDELTDGQEVVVELVDKIELDKNRAPIFSKWAFIAFNISADKQEERAKLIQEMIEERDANRKLKEEQQLALRLQRDRPLILAMRNIMCEQLFDEEATRRVVSKEWDPISSSVLLDNIVPSPEDQSAIRECFTKYYCDISDVFKFFSAINSGGRTDTIEFIEFSKFLLETKVFGQEDHSNAMLKIFVESQINSEDKGGSVNIHTEMEIHEFLLSLIKIAVYKYITLERIRIAELKKKGHEQTISKAHTPSVPEALERLVREFLKPVVEKHAGSTVRNILGSEETLLFLYYHLDELTRAFHAYSERDASEEGEPVSSSVDNSDRSGLMNLKNFTAFAQDAKFLDGKLSGFSDGGTDDGFLTLKDVRQIFSASQHDLAENSDEMNLEQKHDKSFSHQQQMVFSEYIEAIVRLALTKWHASTQMSDLQKIERAVKMCGSIPRAAPNEARI